MGSSFVHLRVYSEYSLLSSVARINQLIQRAKELHMPALAITDQGTMSGVVPFYKACKQEGIKPIIGLEIYLRNQEDVSISRISVYPLLLLAENNQGYQNLLQLLTEAHTNHYRGTPCLTKEQLKKYTPGLIALSSGLEGDIARTILSNKHDEAKQLIYEYIDLFGPDHFFLEIQDNHKQEQQMVNRQLISWSNELKVGLVATNAIRYLEKRDHEAYLCLSSIRLGSMYTKTQQENEDPSSYFKTPEEMKLLFSSTPEAIKNAEKIADRCNVTIELGKKLFPRFPVPNSMTSHNYLRELCMQKVHRRYDNITPEVKDRLEYELNVIVQMDLADYFLVVSDLVGYARQVGIAVGPGRGSAAGSLVCYVLGITEIDPLQYNLFFERFLNPERVSMPDIDLDFSDERREEMIQYTREKYGSNHVAQIVTFGTLAPRAAVRDVGRVLDLPYPKVDQVAKLIPSSSRSLRQAIEEQPILRELVQDPEIQQLLKMVQRIEGLPRHISTHAAGVIISGEPLTNNVPLQQGSAGVPLTEYPMDVLEEIGLLKIDFLGLRNLTVIEKTKEIIYQLTGKTISISNYADPATYALLSSGHTMGVFQVESSGMRRVLQEVKPSCFEDLVAIVALYRPGPMEQIPRFVRAKHGQEGVTYPHADLEEILAPTYGVIVYQEQIIHIASKMAGFSLSEGDSLRRAVSKKKEADLVNQREAFVQGCINQGYDEKTGHQVYDLIVRFANYGFNRSHSVAYGVLAYETAYLKANYPLAYMTALISTVMGNQAKLGEYIGEIRRMGLTLLPPHINKSEFSFSVDNGAIRFGLGAIKYVGGHAIHSIMQARTKGEFKDMVDLCRRIDLKVCNRKMLEALIQCGAVDTFEGHRAMKIVLLDEIMEEGALQAKEQIPLFEKKIDPNPDIDITPYSNQQKLEHELELLGVYVSGHPLDQYEKVEYACFINELKTATNKQKVTFAGMIREVKMIKTKKGEQMAFCLAEDRTGQVEVVIFPRVYSSFRALFRENTPLLFAGEIQTSEKEIQVIAQRVSALTKIESAKVYIRVLDHREEDLMLLKEILLAHVGEVPVYLFYEQTKKLIALPVEKYGIVPSEECVGKISQLLGENSVVIKELVGKNF